jgi:hypothetical protein
MFLPVNPALFATFFILTADNVPVFDVDSHCRTIARRTGVSEDRAACLQDEQTAKAQLVREWAQFTPADKSHCVQLSTLGGDPIYTDLLTCLELERDARKLREKDEDAAASGETERTTKPRR